MLKILDIGIKSDQSVTAQRYIRTTNIVAIMALGFMLLWIFVALLSFDSQSMIITSLIACGLFLSVIYFNRIGKHLLASSWLISIAFFQWLYWIFLFGYDSGVGLISILIIFPPYLTIPSRARYLSHLFAGLACVTWVCSAIYQEYLIPHVHGFDPEIFLVINVAMVSFACLIFLWSLSNNIDRSEKFLDVERKKSDKLLHNILPHSITVRLKQDSSIIADGFDSVSVLFADIVGFTKLSERLTPEELVIHLNEIFSEFDHLVEGYGLEKIKTIGDAYMVSAGLPETDPEHANKIASLAIEMREYMINRAIVSNEKLDIRIGIHSGPAVAGVIGIKKFAYDIWGDTVNTASRMESHGLPNKIHVSETFKLLVEQDFIFEKREPIKVKGKGEMQTFLIIEKVANNA